MWKSFYLDQPLVPLALASMALFVGAFVVVLLRAFRSDKHELDDRARLPLLDEESETHDVH